MKKHSIKFLAILFVLAIFSLASCLKAQSGTVSPAHAKQAPTSVPNAMLDQSGNYVAVTHVKATAEPIPTGKTFTDSKGLVFPVFKSQAGKLYYVRTSHR